MVCWSHCARVQKYSHASSASRSWKPQTGAFIIYVVYKLLVAFTTENTCAHAIMNYRSDRRILSPSTDPGIYICKYIWYLVRLPPSSPAVPTYIMFEILRASCVRQTLISSKYRTKIIRDLKSFHWWLGVCVIVCVRAELMWVDSTSAFFKYILCDINEESSIKTNKMRMRYEPSRANTMKWNEN